MGAYHGTKECYRSRGTWSELVGERITAQTGRRVEVTNRACNAAVTRQIIDVQRVTQTSRFGVVLTASSVADAESIAGHDWCRIKGLWNPADTADGSWKLRAELIVNTQHEYELFCDLVLPKQVDHVDDTFDIVVMTIDGNDLRFGDIALKCLVSIPIIGVDRDKCDKHLTAADKTLSGQDSSGLSEPLGRALDAIDSSLNPPSRVERGHVVLMSYPYLSAPNGYSLDDIEVEKRLSALSNAGDRLQHDLVDLTNTSSFVRGCHHRSATFGNRTKWEFGDHLPEAPINLSGSPLSWLWEVIVPVIDGTRTHQESMHPKPEGYEAIANAAMHAIDAAAAIADTCAPVSSYASIIRGEPGLGLYFRMSPPNVTDPGTAWSAYAISATSVGDTDSALLTDPADRAGTFNGSSQVAFKTDDPYLYGGNAISVEAWVRTSNATTVDTVIVSEHSAGNPRPIGPQLGLRADGSPFAQLGLTYTTFDTVSVPQIYLADGRWHHLVMTYDKDRIDPALGLSRGFRLYVDGDLASVSHIVMPHGIPGYEIPHPFMAAEFKIGQPAATPPFENQHGFVGDIDEVAVYHEALTPAQVKNHYMAGRGAFE